MKQIATFVSEISDEFKVVVVQAIKSLALKFPRKHGILMNFLSSMLRDEGGLVTFSFKNGGFQFRERFTNAY
jgi:coatomer subunit gamma